MSNKVPNDSYSLKALATNPSNLRLISVIVDRLEEQKKMNKMELKELDEQ